DGCPSRRGEVGGAILRSPLSLLGSQAVPQQVSRDANRARVRRLLAEGHDAPGRLGPRPRPDLSPLPNPPPQREGQSEEPSGGEPSASVHGSARLAAR